MHTTLKTAHLLLGLTLLIGPTAFAQTKDAQDALMEDAKNLRMHKLEYFDNGVYGKIGTTAMYFVDQSQLKSLDNLYATMVRVLSVKYGCFMKSRTKSEGSYGFRCKDGRYIVIRHGKSGNTYYFAGRQYYRSGDEVVINNYNTSS